MVLTSNSATTVPAVPERAIRALLAHDTAKAVRAVRWVGPGAGPPVYAAPKIVVSRWVSPTFGTRGQDAQCPTDLVRRTLANRSHRPVSGLTCWIVVSQVADARIALLDR